MEFGNRLKGRLGEGILSELLMDAGYIVAPFGAEHLIRKVGSLTWEQYKALNLDPRIAKLPDFVVVDTEGQSTMMVEVKCRTKWNTEAMVRDLTTQLTFYREIILVAFVAEPNVSGMESASTYLRATRVVAKKTRKDESAKPVISFDLKGGRTETDPKKIGWYDLPKIQDYFIRLKDRKDDGTLVDAINMFRRSWANPTVKLVSK